MTTQHDDLEIYTLAELSRLEHTMSMQIVAHSDFIVNGVTVGVTPKGILMFVFSLTTKRLGVGKTIGTSVGCPAARGRQDAYIAAANIIKDAQHSVEELIESVA